MTDPAYNERYLTRERWMSYVYQVSLIADLAPRRVAEIGVGPGAVRSMLSATYPGCAYVSVDISTKLRPDICASVTALPFMGESFDAVFCCQVLEHLPYSEFVPSLRELGRITKKRLVISLPDISPFFYLRFPGARRLLGSLWRGIDLPNLFPPTHDIAQHGQHYWELGTRGYPTSRILADIERSGLKLRDHFRMTERRYWHFIVMEPSR